MLDHLFTLLMLIVLQAVLGFDNLLYISLESKRAPEADQARVRKLGISIAIGLRIVLLFVLVKLIEVAQSTLFTLHWTGVVEGEFNLHSLIVLVGGAFILYAATKEVIHMVTMEEIDGAVKRESASSKSVITMIVVMNLVFSFDSILSAMALTDNTWVMTIAIVVSGIMMLLLADHVSTFLAKNRMYEVLGLFILFVVGVMLVTEGGHLAHLHLFGEPVTSMTKTTFYFVIVVLVLTDIVQSRYRKKIAREARAGLRN